MWVLFALLWIILIGPLMAGGILAGGTLLALGFASVLLLGLFRFLPFLMVVGVFYYLYRQFADSDNSIRQHLNISSDNSTESCPNCGADVGRDKLICPNCYADLKHNCPHCGEVVDARSTRCESCGRRIHLEKTRN